MNSEKITKALAKAMADARATHETHGDGWFEIREQANATLEAVDAAYSFNEFLREHGNPDDTLEEMEFLDELAECGGDWAKPSYILARAFYGYRYNPYYVDDGSMEREAFNPNDQFFTFNGYGNLMSVNVLDRWQYWASIIDECDYLEAAENEGYLEEVAKALGIEDEGEDEKDGE